MTTFTIEEKITLPKHFKTIDDLLSSIYEHYVFEDSNIQSPYLVADKMKENKLPKDFITHFLKSYE